MRYIDADAFIEEIKTEIMNLYFDGMKGTPRPYKELYDIIDRIEEQPTADVVEVVRCKDCKYFNDIKHTCSLHSHELIRFQVSMEFNDYCSYGERMEQEQ